MGGQRGVKGEGRNLRCAVCCAIPVGPKLPDTIGASFAATGRGWRHPTPHVQAAGAWKEGGMARDPGGPLRPFPAKRQQCRGVGDRRKAHGRPSLRCLTSRSTPSGKPQLRSGAQNRRQRGCREANPGDPIRSPGSPGVRSGGSDTSSRGGRRRSPGAGGQPAPRAAHEAPAYPSHLAGWRPRGWWRAPSGAQYPGARSIRPMLQAPADLRTSPRLCVGADRESRDRVLPGSS
jgi:hypothetical protein